MKKLALVAGCLLFIACSSDGNNAGPGGQGGGHAGAGGGQAGTTGTGGQAGGSIGSAGTTGGGGQTAGTTGSAGDTGSGGQAGGTTGAAGRGGTTGAAGRGGTTGSAGTTGAGGQGGKAGQGGTGGQAGQGGKAGQGGTGGQSCAELETAYAKAMQDARMCNLAVDVPQCTQLALTRLACGCPTYVNDKTELDKIKAQWDAAGCGAAILCPAIACLVPQSAGCVPMDSGDFCVNR